jgi:hypothetical protein
LATAAAAKAANEVTAAAARAPPVTTVLAPAVEPAVAARLIRITIEGLWLEMMSLLNPYDEQEAKRTALTCAALIYPRHFRPEGLLGG